MKTDQVSRLLQWGLADLAEARWHFDYSFPQIAGLSNTLCGATERQLEGAEAFTGRFAHAADLLVNKVLRSLGRVELKPEGTLLDVANSADNRGFVSDTGALRGMKDLRIMIAHDCAGAKAATLLAYLREPKPIFDAICDRAAAYAAQFASEQRSQCDRAWSRPAWPRAKPVVAG